MKPPVWRAALLITAGALLATAAVALYRRGPGGMPWFCPFHELTGLHCPGCGMTRAVYALLHGDFMQAMRMNGVGIFLLPVALVGLSLEAAGWVRGRPLAWRIPVGRRGSLALLLLVTGFWLLRNLPWWPFNLLAPH